MYLRSFGTKFDRKILHSTVDLERYEKVKDVLNCVGLSKSDGEEYIVISDAIIRNEVHIAEELIDEEIQQKKVDLDVPLQLASVTGNIQIINILLDKGANIDCESRYYSETPLYIATKKGHFQVVKLLLERGANVLAERANGWSPFPLACANGNKKIANLLLKYGACLDKKTRYTSQSPLSIVAEKGNAQLAAFLLSKGADTEVQNENKEKAIHFACLNGNKEVVQLLLSHGANINAKTKFNFQTPLHIATVKGNKGLVKLLLKNRADVNIRNNFNETALQFACSYGFEDIVKVLLAWGADPNVPVTTGKRASLETPLITAIYARSNNIVLSLLQHGARLDQYQIQNEWSELHLACENGNEEIIKSLIKYGADINAKTKLRETALQKAITNESFEIINILLDCGADVHELNDGGWAYIHTACNSGSLEIVKLLLKKNANVNACTKDKGNTPLHIAVLKGDQKMVELLLENGANVHKVNVDRASTLHIAAGEGSLKICELLINKGIDVNLVDKRRRSALFIAYRGGHQPVVETLINNGADINFLLARPMPARIILEKINNVNRSADQLVTIVIKEVIKYQLANLYLYDSLKMYDPTKRPEFASFRNSCIEEVMEMKRTKIGDTFISFYDFLHKDFVQISAYLTNTKIIRVLENYNYGQMFPNYQYMLQYKFRRGYKRFLLTDPAVKCIDPITEQELPYLCTIKIVSMLNDQHLENLIEACTSKGIKTKIVNGGALTQKNMNILRAMKNRKIEEKALKK